MSAQDDQTNEKKKEADEQAAREQKEKQKSKNREYFTGNFRPAMPTVMIPYKDQLFALPILSLSVEAEFNVSTAFVRVTGTWQNVAKYTADCIFALPLSGTVTEVNIKLQARVEEDDKHADRDLLTAIIPKDLEEFAELLPDGVEGDEAAEGEKPDGKLPEGISFDEYIPNLFRVPINDVYKRDIITVTAVFIEPLPFIDGKYQFVLPLSCQKELLPKVPGERVPKLDAMGNPMVDQEGKKIMTFKHRSPNSVFSLKCTINSCTHDAVASSASHDIKITTPEQKGQRTEGREHGTENAMIINVHDFENPDGSGGSHDFKLSYGLMSDDIMSTFIDEPLPEEDEGNFLLFVTPPSVDEPNRFHRRMFFLLDRSGSMTGEPYQEATRALIRGLSFLDETDEFAIISFDHNWVSFPLGGGMSTATADHISRAAAWALSIDPKGGGTDIRTPMQIAFDTLYGKEEDDAKRKEEDETFTPALSFVVLITDGCVKLEREICRDAREHKCSARVLTFGIGTYCNWYFLKMLAQICCGFSEVVVYKERINSQIVQLLNMAAHPILTEVRLAIPGVEDVHLFPFPVPDLCKGAPLTITGKYRGSLAEGAVVGLQGLNWEGKVVRKYINVRKSSVIPVAKVFIKQRIDLLSARAWMDESSELKDEVVDLSCAETVPSPYTMMITFEADDEMRKEIEEDDDENNALLGGPQSDSVSRGGTRKLKKKWYKNKAALAGIAAGGVTIVGAALFSFGDLGASAANLPILGDLFGQIGNIDIDLSCCGECGECCGGIGECLQDCSPSDCLIC
jgi:uncharacterized protein YegL